MGKQESYSSVASASLLSRRAVRGQPFDVVTREQMHAAFGLSSERQFAPLVHEPYGSWGDAENAGGISGREVKLSIHGSSSSEGV
jgi:hypothetical protein